MTNRNVTQLLVDLNKGDNEAMHLLLPLVYNELRRLASKYLKAEYSQRTIQTTELVHEAYIRLVGNENLSLQNRGHFFGVAANSMRQILVDRARKRSAIKRGEANPNVSLDDALFISDEKSEEIIALDESLKKLEMFDERLSKIVELRFFAGFTIEETAEILNLSPATIKREWSTAKAWLYKSMGKA